MKVNYYDILVIQILLVGLRGYVSLFASHSVFKEWVKVILKHLTNLS